MAGESTPLAAASSVESRRSHTSMTPTTPTSLTTTAVNRTTSDDVGIASVDFSAAAADSAAGVEAPVTLLVLVREVLKLLGTTSAAAAADAATVSGLFAGDADARVAATVSGASGSAEDGPLTRRCRGRSRQWRRVRVRMTWKKGGWETGSKRKPVCHGDDGDGPFEKKGPPSAFCAEWWRAPRRAEAVAAENWVFLGGWRLAGGVEPLVRGAAITTVDGGIQLKMGLTDSEMKEEGR